MFLGHYGAALVAKRAAPRASLGTLIIALWLFVVWGWWVDRHRVAPDPAPAAGVAHG